jgi:proteasome accessory factor C
MIEYYHPTDVVRPATAVEVGAQRATHETTDQVRAKNGGADWAWLVRFALRHAGTVRVIEPAQLAADVAAAARAALSAYDGINPGTAKE